jgi:hypothetical protein
VITINTGFARIPAKAARAKLSATDWAVLHAIGLHADKDGKAFPSMARIAEIAGLKRNHVPRSVARLEQRSLLRRERMPRPNGGWQVTHYELFYEPIGDVTPDGDTTSEHVTNGGDTTPNDVTSDGDRCHHPREQGVTPDGALTNHLTNHRTQSYQEEGRRKVEGINGGGVPQDGDTQPDPPMRCARYVANPHGFTICGAPTEQGAEYCPKHTF